MLTIITGEINSGKTVTLYTLYRQLMAGDGFLLPKVMSGRVVVGQRIERLSTGESRFFSCRTEFLPQDWDEAYRYRDYSFSKTGLEFGRDTIREILTLGISPVFFDEIGPLELCAKGFCQEFRAVLQSPSDVYAAVRQSCLPEVIKFFLEL